MKKVIKSALIVTLILSFAPAVIANESLTIQLIGREIYAGREVAGNTVGALFVGKFFDLTSNEVLGRFTISLDHDGENIEMCDHDTELRRFKLILNFYSGARLVLVGPTRRSVNAMWDWDDPNCFSGDCPIIDAYDYMYYLDLLEPGTTFDLVPCSDDSVALIAEVSTFELERQWWGSWRTSYTEGTVSGHLVHTPIVSPAIFGQVELNE